jgi:hypothetical protein
VGGGARSLDCVVVRSLSEAVAIMWKVHRLWEILPMASWVPGYSENNITQQSLPVNCRRVGSVDHPVWCDKETTVTYRTENIHAVKSH